MISIYASVTSLTNEQLECPDYYLVYFISIIFIHLNHLVSHDTNIITYI